tara:strand:+ start:7327 stop:7845 length:519 start_codon:yes stop_codon:yes gene_type:complete
MTTQSKTGSPIKVNTSQMSDEIWPLVALERRSDNSPVFASKNALKSHIAYAFHNRRIKGSQSGRGNAISVDREELLEYITKYVELAKSCDKVYWPKRSASRRNSSSSSSNGNGNGNSAASEGSQWLVMGGDGAPYALPKRYATAGEAALALLRDVLGARVYKCRGNTLEEVK